MNDTRRAVDAQGIGLMLLLCLVLAFQQILLKAVADDIAPMLQIALRSGIAAALVLLMMAWQREPMNVSDGTLRPGLLAGALFALEFILIGAAVTLTSASRVIVFLYTAPIFAALGLAWRLPSERLQPAQWVGIALAFVGLSLALLGPRAGGDFDHGHPHAFWGDGLAMLAGAAWGATTVVVRCSALAAASAKKTLLYQLVVAFVVITIVALATGQTTFLPTARAWGSLVFQGVVGAFASFLLWFWLLTKYKATRLGVFWFATPLFGLAMGVAWLGEPLSRSFVAGTVLVLAGLVMVSGYDWYRGALARR